MKAIILAAGKGTRLQPLTFKIPKAMVELYKKPLLAHNMDKLIPYVDEFIVVVKYKQEYVRNYFWNEYQWIKISYYEQWEKTGTAGALEGLKLSWDCFILASDTIYRQSDIDMIAKYNWYAALCLEVENPEKWGIFKTDSEDYILEVIEKPQTYIGNIASLFFFKVNNELIELTKKLTASPRGEYELTDALNLFVKKYPVKALRIQNNFIDITSVEDWEKANTLIKPKLWSTQYLENIWEYEIHLGIPENWIQEIVNYSTDETDTALQEWTSDWKKRFISTENLTNWYNDVDRYPFTILSKEWKVAWLWWWRPAKLPNITDILNQDIYNVMLQNEENIHTSWIRIYPFARWERLASPFMQVCERCYKNIFTDVYMSDDIGAENIPSQKAFERLGYTKVGYGKNINNSPESGRQRFVYMKKF